MSIDVFGRQLTKSFNRNPAATAASARGPPGEGFRVTTGGDYDMNNKRLCNIGDPVESNDATSIKVSRSIVKEETRALYQITQSLRETTDNNYLIINALQTEFQNQQKNYRLGIDSLQSFATRNVESIQQIDSKLISMEKTCNDLAASIQKFEKILNKLEESDIYESIKKLELNFKQRISNLEDNLAANVEDTIQNMKSIGELDFRLKEHNG